MTDPNFPPPDHNIGVPAAGFSEPEYRVQPMPVGRYGIPFGVTEPITHMFRLYQADFGRLVLTNLIMYAIMMMGGIFVVIGAVAMGISGAFDKLDHMDTAEDFMAALPYLTPMFVAGGIFLGVCILVALAIVGANLLLLDEKARGAEQTLNPWTAFVGGIGHIGRVFVGSLVNTAVPMLLAYSAFGIAIGVGIATESFGAGALAFVPASLLIVAGCYLGARLSPLLPVLVLEDRPIGDAFSRALTLTRGRAGSIFLATLLFVLVWMGVNMAVQMVGIVPFLGALIALAAGVVLAPIPYAWMFSLYAGLVDSEGGEG